MEGLLSHARRCEGSADYTGAIDTYLRLGPVHSRDPDMLEEAWEKAVELASKFVPARLPAVVVAAASKLADLGRHEPAADLYIGADMTKEAVETCIAGALWDKARGLAADLGPEVTAHVSVGRAICMRVCARVSGVWCATYV